jgi:cytidine deaminase
MMVLPLKIVIAKEQVIDQKTKEKLIQIACEASHKTYSPYSHYPVGAAVLTSTGLIFKGTNVENASYGLTCCADRIAIFKAISEGHKDLIAIAIVTKDGGLPCGACRQVINEFNSKMMVIIGDTNGNILKETTIDQLLPDAFGPKNLKEASDI